MPEGFRAWKRKEKQLYRNSVAGVRSLSSKTYDFFRYLAVASRRKTSILVLRDSAVRPGNIRLSNLALASLLFIFVAVLAFSVYSAARFGAVAANLEGTKRELVAVRANLDALRDGTEELAGTATRFESGLARALGSASQARAGGDALDAAGLSRVLPAGYADSGKNDGGIAARELSKVRSISVLLESATPTLDRIATLLAGEKEIMTEIPNIWPIRGGYGHVSMYFGQNENPFSGGQWYLHNGIDISTFRTGDPILATASGRVASLGYDPSLGLFVILQHSHGFYTRYGHLQAIRVQKGQLVSQGQLIGTLGNSGKTTGPHLHYEVHLGTSVIDPLRFLNTKSSALPVGQPK